MSNTVIKVENLSKQYRLGDIGTGAMSHDINRWWYKIRGKDDPYLKIGEENDRSKKGNSDYVWSLKDINFEIKQGDAVGIIGRNGAGKSTLLKILSKVTSPTTGSIKIKGRVASLLEVGTGFHPELSGRENIFLNGAILGMTNQEVKARFDEIVDFSGVEKYIDTPVKRYSSGMYVRLAFAVAAHLEPEILIVDEVLAVGDIEFQKKCLGKMQDVNNNQGRTVLFVSHNMAAIQNLCTSGIFLMNGYIKAKHEISQVIGLYLNSYLSNSSIALADRKDRSGTGEVTFVSVRYRDMSRNNLEVLICGMTVQIVLKLQKTNSSVLRKLDIAIGIDDPVGQRICVINTEIVNASFYEVKNLNDEVIITIPRLPFKPGNYTYTLFAKANGEIADWIQNAGSFFVESGDYYNTGQLPPIEQGVFYLDYEFSK